MDLGKLLERVAGRGERALSLADLIENETLSMDLAAWLVSRVSRGESYVVGARRRNVGKTTTMNALLSVVPRGLAFVEALPDSLSAMPEQKACVVAHELSDHRREWYLWEQDLRDFLALTERGHMIAGNMHADTLEEVHTDICAKNGVPEERFRAVKLLLFLGTEDEGPDEKRLITRACHSDGKNPHRCVFIHGKGFTEDAPRDAAHEERCRAFLEEVLAGSLRTVEEIRRLYTDWAVATP